MTNTSYDLTGKLEPMVIELLCCFHRIAQQESIPFLVVGATVRDMVMQVVHKLSPPTTTRDVDFGVMLDTWKDFTRLERALIASNRFVPDPKEQQRFRFDRGIEVDVVPFGGIERDNHVHWPPDGAFIMNAVGYRDALESALRVKINRDISIRVASIPALVMLKLFAWDDRPSQRAKDLKDVNFLLRKYIEAGNYDRLFKDENKPLYDQLLATSNIDTASARLLGRDLRWTVSLSTQIKLRNFVNEHIDPTSPLLLAMAAATGSPLESSDTSLESLWEIWSAFAQGLNE
jgi:predicted nucleotidyltransferase